MGQCTAAAISDQSSIDLRRSLTSTRSMMPPGRQSHPMLNDIRIPCGQGMFRKAVAESGGDGPGACQIAAFRVRGFVVVAER